jgi:tRNA(Ile)-lysidine synthase
LDLAEKQLTKGKDRTTMLDKILDFVNANHMIEQGDRVVVGVSGGADSVCLLYALLKLYQNKKVTFHVVHVNHGIRGTEADRDELFVSEVCKSMGVTCRVYSEDVRTLAKELGISEEEAGRNVRYEAFIRECYQRQCNKIAVAHNKNDNAETFLFNLFRGTGIKGLTGIGPSRAISGETGDITLIRPLLCVERKEIEAYLRTEGISYIVDSTNLTEDYSRNKIRNRILAYAVGEINAGSISNINETAGKLTEAWEYIDNQVSQRFAELVRQENGEYSFTVSSFLKEPLILQKGILRKILEKLAGHLKDLETKHVEALLSLTDKQVGRRISLPYGILAERCYEDIRLFRAEGCALDSSEFVPMEPVTATIPGLTIITQKRKIFETKLLKYEKNEPIPKSSCMKWFDYDKIENAVVIRNRREGDYIQINSSGGHKKLKDYFIDQKIPQKLRDSRLLVADGNHIMWIPGDGERMSEKYKVDPTTQNVLLMKMINLEENEDDR